MTQQLLCALTQPAVRNRLSAAAREKSNDFDGQKCIDRMQSKYEEIMHSRPDKR